VVESRIGLTAVVPAKASRPGVHLASTHIRLLRRFEHPIVRRFVAATVLDQGSPLLDARADLVLVQRTALAPEDVEPVVKRLRRRGTPLVVELDDNLFLKGPEDEEYGPYLGGLARLLEAARLVTVSTEPLRAALTERNENIVVVENVLDEQLWLPVPHPRPGPGTRLLFFGTRTHSKDLALLRPAIEALRREAGLHVTLFVISGEPKGEAQDWYTRLKPPRKSREYPGFVRWLKEHASDFDVGVAPLVDDEFNRSKSDIKFLDYSALGLPGVYSDVPAFASCVDGITGLKAANTVGDWCDALARLCTDVELRMSLAQAAQEYVVRERLLGHSAGEYAELLVGAARGESARKGWRLVKRGRWLATR
jgi:glycosyltransferase involved in cell wall biosynthesis